MWNFIGHSTGILAVGEADRLRLWLSSEDKAIEVLVGLVVVCNEDAAMMHNCEKQLECLKTDNGFQLAHDLVIIALLSVE